MDQETTPSVSVVIPTYRGVGRLERVVRPLLSEPAVLEVIVVVDGSRDGSLELLEEMASTDPRVKPIFIENAGEMRARAEGVARAQGEVILFLDHDVAAEPGLVSGHARKHREGKRLLVLGYMPVELPARRRPGDFATHLYAAGYEERCAIYDHDPVSVLRELWGGNFSMRREHVGSVELVGASHYHADRELGNRLLEAGFEGEFDRSLRARHLHDRPLDAFSRDARSQGAGRVHVHRLHEATLGPLPEDAFEEGLPPWGRRLLRATRRRGIRAPVSSVLRVAIVATGYARWWRAQDLAAKFLRRVEQQYGAIEAAKGRTWGRVRTYATDPGKPVQRA